MRNPDWWTLLEGLESYSEIPYGTGVCDDEFVGILAMATESGSPMDILMELLEDLTTFEQKHGSGFGEFDPFDQDYDTLDMDFLLWSRTYYRFIALSALARGQ
ncbi:MAG: hypothetical protein KKA73_17750 [Chloroflexi bacterium]|nr:hypothetical protein [Chloroflexota bacterium]MBU1749533.1 hypothetical protein [Chloroflexota bacterium]